jgi:hypothetical protein
VRSFSAIGIVVLSLAVLSTVGSPAWRSSAWCRPIRSRDLVHRGVHRRAGAAPVVRALTLSVLYFHTAGALLAYLLADEEVSRDELYCIGATFTAVAWAFAHLYSWCQVVYPDSFTAAVDAGDPRSWMELLFLSFTTLSSTGLSDVVPVLPFARGLVMLEQVAGVGYIAMVCRASSRCWRRARLSMGPGETTTAWRDGRCSVGCNSPV